MTRMIQLVSAVSLTGALAAAAIGACGGAPGELPPVAPRPDPMSPGSPGATRHVPLLAPSDGGPALSPGPVSVRVVPTPEFASAGPTVDAGADPDSYEPPLPPIPDGGVPIDGHGEPK